MPTTSNISRLNPKECQIFGIFRDQSPHTKSKRVIYKIEYNKTTIVKYYVIYILIMYNFSQMTGVGLSTRVNEVWVDARAYSVEELVNLVSEETLTRKRNEKRLEYCRLNLQKSERMLNNFKGKRRN